MDTIEDYIQSVMRNIHAPAQERQRIESDLRAHFAEAIQVGQAPKDAIAHPGAPWEVAAEFMSQVRLVKEAFLRRISYYFDILLVDALFIPFTARRQRAFDIVARTVVVRSRD